MHSFTARCLVLILVATTAISHALTASARCAPKYTLKIVTTFDAPGIPPDNFIRRPKTLYRSGERLGRIEEELNPETGIHLLVVVNGADLWMVNRADGTGRHAIDPGPSLAFHAPITGDLKSEYWTQFEFGCEVPFMEAVGAKLIRDDANGLRYFEHTHDGVTARLHIGKTGLPSRVVVETADARFSFTYREYSQIVEADESLFARPAGVQFEEARE